ncbi:imidazole glycerol phosphate synthase subunit HisF [Desulfohalovibrio reitneri]|uniref:imidazole glycerol phosphate synthase subunit HisF n=1 Tax=Desulfohalovibrio reitneri TaxID=1307759 RepID=UPI0009DEFF38|nr:imidazole glycerol phosphate synthase cyclase subunit [Desulfohalovibrio reitneri]
MIKNRLIASLLVYNGQVVQARKFKRTNMVGSAFTAVDFFNAWTVDEIMVLEISYTRTFMERFVDILNDLSKRCFVPLSVGGKVDSLEHVHRLTRVGADKVVVNTNAVRNPVLVRQIADNYGTQCCVVSIDCRPNEDMPSGYEPMIDNGKMETGLDALEWASHVVELGAGELMINSLEYDGNRQGYDLNLVRAVADSVPVPVIAFGGVGKWEHFVEGVREGHADAVAAGNIFHYTEHSTKKAKDFMAEQGIPVRASTFYKVDMPRHPQYEKYLKAR